MIVVCVFQAVSTAIRAEKNLHASLFVVRLVEEFTYTNNRWPTSWAELENMPFSGDGYSPRNGELSALRIGGACDFGWPADSEMIQGHVAIDFSVDVSRIADQDCLEFDAIKPIGACFEYRDYGTVESLLVTLEGIESN